MSKPSESTLKNTDRIAYWYFGGVASAGAACCTHPLDLIKVHLQLDAQKGKGFLTKGTEIYKAQGSLPKGVRSLYSGLTASIGRQLTYSLTRFAVYDKAKEIRTENKRNLTLAEKVSISFFGGCIGGLIGTPCDLVNVRMQNDSALKLADRRNYKHVFNGLGRIYKGEGPKVLMNGYQMATVRAGMMTVGQLAMYEIFKEFFLNKAGLKDNMATHFLCSSLAGICGCLYTMPLDVMKTKLMAAKPGQYPSIFGAVKDTYR